MKDLTLPWKLGLIKYKLPQNETVEKPFDYQGHPYPSIYAANGEEVVGCDEYYIFHSPEVVRLFIAAPELLECLEFIVNNHAPAMADLLFGEGWIDHARNVINKAKGETK